MKSACRVRVESLKDAAAQLNVKIQEMQRELEEQEVRQADSASSKETELRADVIVHLKGAIAKLQQCLHNKQDRLCFYDKMLEPSSAVHE